MSHRFVFFMKVVIDAKKMSMTFLFFALFLRISPRNHPQPSRSSPSNLEDHYPPTMKICDPSLPYDTSRKKTEKRGWLMSCLYYFCCIPKKMLSTLFSIYLLFSRTVLFVTFVFSIRSNPKYFILHCRYITIITAQGRL